MHCIMSVVQSGLFTSCWYPSDETEITKELSECRTQAKYIVTVLVHFQRGIQKVH